MRQASVACSPSCDPPTPWLVTPRRPGEPKATLVVFPYAGLGGSLAAALSREIALPIALHGVQLPGHETRLAEPPLTRMADVIEAMLPALARLARAPCILMGCSMGALIAYEAALRLASVGTPPLQLVVLACGAPCRQNGNKGLSTLPDDAFLSTLDERFGGVPAAVRLDPELRQVLLPALRADMALLDAYRWAAPPRLDVPVVTMAASDDRHIPPAALLAWAELTTAPTEHHIVAGGHFVLRENPGAVAAVLEPMLHRAIA